MNRHQRRAAEVKSGKNSEKQPRGAGAPLDAGIEHYQAGRLTEAELCCHEILALNPDFPDALHLLGLIAIKAQRFDEAVQLFVRAIRKSSTNPDYFLYLGWTLGQLDRSNEALSVFDQMLIRWPDSAKGYYHRARILEKLQRYDDALPSYDSAILINPNYLEAYTNSALVLFEKKRFAEALERFDRAVLFDPKNADTIQNRGLTLQKLDRIDDAIVDYRLAIKLNPDLAAAYNNLGTAFEAKKQFEAALENFERAAALQLNRDFLNNQANALLELRQFDELWMCYDRLFALYPDFAKGHFNEGMYRLLVGDFGRGWAKREWRWKCPELKLDDRAYPQPVWYGTEPLDGKTILIHNDEGFGDAIQFCRYIPLVKARGARVVIEVERPLLELFASLDGVAACFEKGVSLPQFDFHCSLGRLPVVFDVCFETILSSVPYLAPPIDAGDWRERLGTDGRPKVGIVWSGNPTHNNDRNRSIPLEAWTPVLGLEAQFLSLQKFVRAEDAEILKKQSRILDLGGELKSFADTAALIETLDLVITVDTSVAHLAGALGRPVWILLPFTPDWRWLLDRDDSPWYPTARLFRQTEAREWSSVMECVKSALQQRMTAKLQATSI
jgi:tetratricopeptide (TPR) repeat protein